jgi:hypothetical protein
VLVLLSIGSDLAGGCRSSTVSSTTIGALVVDVVVVVVVGVVRVRLTVKERPFDSVDEDTTAVLSTPTWTYLTVAL